MTNFTFRAYIPRTGSNSESAVPRKAPAPTQFTPYIPPGGLHDQEPEAFSHAVPPFSHAGPFSLASWKTFTPTATVCGKRGSYSYDLAKGGYTLSWPSLAALHAWIRAEDALTRNHLDFDGADDIQSPSAAFQASAPPADHADLLSAQSALLESMARYNKMFPPDVPQQTSYYRDNTYLPTATGSYYR
ncbi:hypothetical protein C8R47DRAFT_1220650 [Mycena vitilis]|nr:hypothetical protein C8R47DRAFT_1220650 [Mycena vitilis]